MSGMTVNGAAILGAISRKPEDFGFNEAQINDLAKKALMGKLKDKQLKIEKLRSLSEAVGESDFKLLLDDLLAKEATTLLKRLDGKNPDLKGADEAWTRKRVADLILHGADVITPPSRAKSAQSTGSKTGKALQSKALKPRAPRKKVSPSDAAA